MKLLVILLTLIGMTYTFPAFGISKNFENCYSSENSCQIESDEILEQLSSLESNNIALRQTARNALNRYERSPLLIRYTLDKHLGLFSHIFEESSWQVKMSIIRFLSIAKLSKTILLAVKSTSDKDGDIRKSAIKAVRSVSSTRHFLSLSSRYINELGTLSIAPNWIQRQQAIYALGETRSPKAKAYIEMALSDSDDDVRNAARLALRKIQI